MCDVTDMEEHLCICLNTHIVDAYFVLLQASMVPVRKIKTRLDMLGRDGVNNRIILS